VNRAISSDGVCARLPGFGIASSVDCYVVASLHRQILHRADR
jgi:hypothetical protein